jgi:hypothetical protein
VKLNYISDTYNKLIEKEIDDIEKHLDQNPEGRYYLKPGHILN